MEWTWAGSKDPGCQSAPWQLYRQTEPGRRHRGTCVQLPNCTLYLPAAWLTTGLLHGAAHPGTSTAVRHVSGCGVECLATNFCLVSHPHWFRLLLLGACRYPALSCAELVPERFIVSYWSSNKRAHCLQECPAELIDAGLWGPDAIDLAGYATTTVRRRRHAPLAPQPPTPVLSSAFVGHTQTHRLLLACVLTVY